MLFGDLRDLSWLRGQYADIMESCWSACGGGGRGGGAVEGRTVADAAEEEEAFKVGRRLRKEMPWIDHCRGICTS